MPKQRKSKEEESMQMDCVRKTELSYHDVAPVQDSIEKEYYQDVSSESTTPNARTLEFNIGAAASNVFLDPAKSYLKIRVRVKNANAESDDLHDTTENLGAKLSLVNNFFHTLFSNIDVSLNDVFVTRSYSNYGYKAYMQNLLTYSKDVKDSGFLICEGWKTDEDTKYEDFTSQSIVARRNWVKGKKTLELAATLKCDLFQQHKLIPSQVNVKIRCVRSDNNFALLDLCTKAKGEAPSNQGIYKIIIDSAVFRARRVQITQQEEFRLIKELQVEPYRIPVRRTDVTVQTVAPGVRNVTIERVHDGQLPRLLLVALVDSTAYNGSINKNPYLFGQYNVESMAIYVNGVMHPTRPFQPDFKNGMYTDTYIALCNVIGSWRNNHIPGGLSYNSFRGGAAIYPFSIAPETNTSNCDFINPYQTGNVSLEIKFNDAVPDHGLNVILYSEFDGNNIFIGETRQVTTDYQ